MNTEREFWQEEFDIASILNRYNDMVNAGKRSFFDVHEFECLIEYFYQQGNLNSAADVLQLAVTLHPNSVELKIKKAQVCIDKGEAASVFPLLDELEKLCKSNVDVYLLKGSANIFVSKIPEAIECFNKALTFHIENKADILYNIAINFENANEFPIAIEYLLQSHAIAPEQLSNLVELGYCYERIEELEKSIDYYNKYLDIDAFSDTVWFNLGGVYSKFELFKKAIDAYDFAIALNNNNSLAYFNKANCIANLGRYEEAISVYKEYLFFEENHLETLCYIGECYERLSQLDDSIYFYQKALEIDASHADAIYGLSIVYCIRNRNTESLQLLNKAIFINPNNSEYWYSLGNLYVKLKLPENAIEAYNKAVEIEPCDFESWLNLAEIYYNKNLLTKAIKILEESYKHNSDVAIINYRLAAYNLLRRNFTDGLFYLRKGIKEDYNLHHEIFKYCPNASDVQEIRDLISQFKQQSHEF